MRNRTDGLHHHRCADCGAKTLCDGIWQENYDGEPEVICDVYHIGHNPDTNPDFVCEGCDLRRNEASEEPEGDEWGGGFADNH